MGQSRDAQRLQRLAGARVHAAVLVDRPKGFGLPKDALLAVGSDTSEQFVTALRGQLTDDERDPVIEEGLANAAFIGVTSSEVLIAARSRFTGRPKHLLRREAIADVRVRWIDDERDGLRSRLLLLEFGDRSWAVLATPWKRLVPDDVAQVIQTFGPRARRVPRPEAGTSAP